MLVGWARLMLILALIRSARCEFVDLLNLLKTVDGSGSNTDCIYTITESGIYNFDPPPRTATDFCEVKIIVPNETMAFVRPTERTCETTSSANISEMCSTARQEEMLSQGVHQIRFDATESVSIRVTFLPILHVECDHFVKNLVTSVNSVILLKNTHKKADRCMLRLPPSVTVELLQYRRILRSKPCCPDVFMASSAANGDSVEYSENINACEIDDQSDLKFHSRCRNSFLYFRNAKKKDTLMFRVTPRHRDFLNDCIPSPMPSVQNMNYNCMPNPYFLGHE